jgi:hypothetical protein
MIMAFNCKQHSIVDNSKQFFEQCLQRSRFDIRQVVEQYASESIVPAFADHNVRSIFHLTHCKNLRSILANGLFSHNRATQYVDISNQSVNVRRRAIEPVYGRQIHDYVPFYFNPRNAMLYAAEENFGTNNLVLLGFSSDLVTEPGALFSDRNSACRHAMITNNKAVLPYMPWNKIYHDSWREFDKSVKQTMMAEVLLPDFVAINELDYILCYDLSTAEYVKQLVDELNLSQSVSVYYRSPLFFAATKNKGARYASFHH